MLVASRKDDYRIVAQNEHAAMAGRFADRWGNDRFAPPRPTAAMRAAGYVHDNGWSTWDLYPHLDADGSPINLFEVPTESWEQFYERGIENAVTLDPYVGLLVSMHGSGIRRQRYGTAPSMPDRSDEYAAFVDREETRQQQLVTDLRESDRYGGVVDTATAEMLETLHETGAYDGDTPLWQGYCLLQLWDQLSLHFCLDPTLESTTFGPAPIAPGKWTDIDVTVSDATTALLDPYPFDADPLVIPVRTRTIPKREYGNAQDLVTTYYDADLEMTEFTVLG